MHLGKSKGTRTAVRAVTELEFMILERRWREDGMTIGYARMVVSWLSFNACGDMLLEDLAGPRDESTGLRILRAYDNLVANHAAALAAITPARMVVVGERAIEELRPLVLSSRPVITTSRMREVFAASRHAWVTLEPARQAIIVRWERWWGPGDGEIRLSSVDARFAATLGTPRGEPQAPQPSHAQ